MKNLKKLASGAVAVTMLATSAFVPSVAQAEVSASASVANMYLWRGLDLGDGSPAVSGDITYSAGGFYAGVWGSSGDDTLGNEYDLYVGFAGEAGIFSYDISYWSYIYPDTAKTIEAGLGEIDGIGDTDDLIVSLGIGDFGVTLYEALSEPDDADDYRYVTLGYTAGDFDFTVGWHDLEDDATHLQIGYAYNDNLSFAISKFIDDGEGAVDDSLQFLVSYSLDIK